eukprot:246658-Pyramimonas_sp.AAC.1
MAAYIRQYVGQHVQHPRSIRNTWGGLRYAAQIALYVAKYGAQYAAPRRCRRRRRRRRPCGAVMTPPWGRMASPRGP